MTLSPKAALALAVLATSWGAILARLCSSGPIAIAFYRVALSALIVSPFALARRRGSGARASPRSLWLTAASGALLALHFATWIASLRYTSVGSSVLLVSTQPLFGVFLSAWFLGERAGGRTLAAVGVTLAGTAIVAWNDTLGGGGSEILGDLLALAGAASAAGYLLIGRAVRAEIAFAPYFLRVTAAAAAVLYGLMAIGGPTADPHPGSDWPWFVLMAAGPGVAGHGLLNWAVRRVRAYVVNAALLGEPVLATLYAWVLFREAPGAVWGAGAALVVGGLAWIFAEEGREAGGAPIEANGAVKAGKGGGAGLSTY